MDMSLFGCCYKTPCGWCSKWDKECDRKIGSHSYIGMRYKLKTYDDACDECVRDFKDKEIE